MAESRQINLRTWIGNCAWCSLVALLWQDEARVVPVWLRVLAIPILFMACLWAYYPVVLRQLETLRKSPIAIPGDEHSERISRIWPTTILIGIGLILTTTVFASGYQFHKHMAMPSMRSVDRQRSQEENRRQTVKKHLKEIIASVPQHEGYTQEAGEKWLAAASTYIYSVLKHDSSLRRKWSLKGSCDTRGDLENFIGLIRTIESRIELDDLAR